MDKYEYKLKLEQMKALASEGEYDMASQLADTVNWRKVRNANSLCKVAEIYENVGRLEDCRDLLLLAYDRSPIGRMIIYRLAMVAIRMNSMEEAEEYYQEFVDIAPHDNLKYILRYKIHKAEGKDIRIQIQDLCDLKEQEYTEEWAFELASLYSKANMIQECVDACDELILWFGDGRYVEKALRLKMNYQELSPQQQEKYRQLQSYTDNIMEIVPDSAVEDIYDLKEDTSQRREKTQASALEREVAAHKMAHGSTDVVSDVFTNEKKTDIMEDLSSLKSAMLEKMHESDNVKSEAEYNNIKEPASEDNMADISDSELEKELIFDIDAMFTNENKTFDHDEDKDLVISDIDELIQEDNTITQEERTNSPARTIEEVLGNWKQYSEATEKEIERTAQEDAKRKREEELERQRREELERQRREEELERQRREELERQRREEELERQRREELEREEEQITDQERILREVEQARKRKEEAERALKEAEAEYARKTATERILHEAEDIMDKLVDVIPKLDTQQIHEKLQDTNMTEEEAGEILGGMIDLLQDQIDKINSQNNHVDIVNKAVERRADAIDLTDEEELGMIELSEDEELPTIEPILEEPISDKDIEISDIDDIDDSNLVLPDIEMTKQAAVEQEEYILYEEEFVSEPTVRMPDLNSILRKNKEAIKQHETLLKEDETEDEAYYAPEPLEAINMEVAEGIDVADYMSDEVRTIVENRTQRTKKRAKLPKDIRGIFSYFIPVTGMEAQLCGTLNSVLEKIGNRGDSKEGNIIIQGIRGSGKTVLAADIIKALQKQSEHNKGRVGKIEASALNQKDIPSVIKKVAGGYLIIERAGDLSRETAARLSMIMENNTDGLVIIMEDTKAGINKVLGKDPSFSRKFTEKIEIPYFTSDELVAFGRAYAKDMGYRIDEMGILALYNRISNIQKYDQATTLTEVKEIVDDAIAQSEKGGIKKRLLGMFSTKKGDADEYLTLQEKDFE